MSRYSPVGIPLPNICLSYCMPAAVGRLGYYSLSEQGHSFIEYKGKFAEQVNKEIPGTMSVCSAETIHTERSGG
jgi:hypothetical protein